jgi:UDP-2,3-diacylglucosamine pyrophosphatase LpxH
MDTTLIISDLHLGARNSRADQVTELLRTDFQRLILNGDTLDNLNFERFRTAHWEALEQLRRVARRRELILIRGNHEASHEASAQRRSRMDVLTNMLGVAVRDEYYLRVGKRRYLICHGDRFDQTLRMTWVGDLADWFYARVQDCSRPLAHWLKGRVKKWGGVLNSVRDGALAHARQNRCDGIILGHTHYSADEVHDGIHYLNSGCWVDAPCSYIRADDSAIELCQWHEGQAVVPAVDLAPATILIRVPHTTFDAKSSAAAPVLQTAL